MSSESATGDRAEAELTFTLRIRRDDKWLDISRILSSQALKPRNKASGYHSLARAQMHHVDLGKATQQHTSRCRPSFHASWEELHHQITYCLRSQRIGLSSSARWAISCNTYAAQPYYRTHWRRAKVTLTRYNFPGARIVTSQVLGGLDGLCHYRFVSSSLKWVSTKGWLVRVESQPPAC